jgi:integrative and conjugative element protein (TIGR02256 family)
LISHLAHIPLSEPRAHLRPGTGGIVVNAEAMAALRAWIHADGANEAGGILLGRYQEDGAVCIDAITNPGPLDIREPRYFFRHADHHNAAILAAWSASDGRVHYLGHWHTHSEPVPVPSDLDRSEWERDAAEVRAQRNEPNLPRIYLIVGQTHLGGWTVDPASIRPADDGVTVESGPPYHRTLVYNGERRVVRLNDIKLLGRGKAWADGAPHLGPDPADVTARTAGLVRE